MKDSIRLTSSLIIVLAIITSCSKDLVIDNFKSGSYSIRSIFSDGKTSQKFIYNDSSKILEDQSFYFCNRYTYDNNGRLIKQEIAVDPDMVSSTIHIKSELMTSQNSTFTGNYIFEYNNDGKLTTKKNYFIKNNQFEYTSMNTFEYDGDRIVKWNLHNEKNVITQYYTYLYDSKGNITNEKHYSYLFNVGSEPKLIMEVSFKYDDKNNPFKIYKELGLPGLYSNTNNIIESNSVLYEDVPGIDKFSTSKTTYEYNNKDFPIKVNNAEEYRYE
jgi:hypothetical protein